MSSICVNNGALASCNNFTMLQPVVYAGSKFCLSLDMCTAFAKLCGYVQLRQMSRASTRGDGKCRVDAHEIHTCLYKMTIT